MTNEQIIQEVNKKLTDIWTKGQKEYISQIVSPNVNYLLNNTPLKGEAPLRDHLNELEASFQDLQYNVREFLHTEDKVVQRWTGKGVFTAPFRNLKPTNKPFEYGGMTVFRIKEGKISDIWIYNNLHEALEKNGNS